MASENETVEEELNCGKAVNFTYYDELAGVANRLEYYFIYTKKW